MPPLFLWLVILLVLAAALYGLRRNERPRFEPACGRCRYSVRGLPTSICPECGADLQTVGLWRTTTSPGLTLSAQMLVSAFLCLGVFVVVANTIPVPRLLEWSRVAVFQAQNTRHRFILEARWREWRVHPPNRMGPGSPTGQPAAMSLALHDDAGATHRLLIDLSSMKVLEASGSSQQRVGELFDEAAASGWIAGATTVLNDEQRAHQASTLVEYANSGTANAQLTAISERLWQKWIANHEHWTEPGPLMTAGWSGGCGNRSDIWFIRGGLVLTGLVWLWMASVFVKRWRRQQNG